MTSSRKRANVVRLSAPQLRRLVLGVITEARPKVLHDPEPEEDDADVLDVTPVMRASRVLDEPDSEEEGRFHIEPRIQGAEEEGLEDEDVIDEEADIGTIEWDKGSAIVFHLDKDEEDEDFDEDEDIPDAAVAGDSDLVDTGESCMIEWQDTPTAMAKELRKCADWLESMAGKRIAAYLD